MRRRPFPALVRWAFAWIAFGLALALAWRLYHTPGFITDWMNALSVCF